MVGTRINALRTYYAGYLETLRPRERYLRPRADFLILEPEMQTIIEGPAEEGVDEDQRMQRIVEEEIEHYVDLYRQTKEGELCDTLKQRLLPVGDGVPLPIELATAVFLCHTPEDVIIGSRNHNAHKECAYPYPVHYPSANMFIYRPDNRMFADVESNFAAHLVRLAGLDPATATAEEMDELDLRFVNDNWLTDQGWGVYTWRMAVRVIQLHPQAWPSMRLTVCSDCEPAQI